MKYIKGDIVWIKNSPNRALIGTTAIVAESVVVNNIPCCVLKNKTGDYIGTYAVSDFTLCAYKKPLYKINDEVYTNGKCTFNKGTVIEILLDKESRKYFYDVEVLEVPNGLPSVFSAPYKTTERWSEEDIIPQKVTLSKKIPYGIISVAKRKNVYQDYERTNFGFLDK